MTQNNVQLQNGNGPLAGLRNQLINGDFYIAQRATTGSGTGYVTVDRWYQYNTTGTVFTQRQDGFGPFATSIRLLDNETSGDAYIAQGIELPFSGYQGQFETGSTWTLSFWSTVATSASNIGIAWQDTISSPDGVANTVGPVVIGETQSGYTHYSFRVTISATAPVSATCLRVLITYAAPVDASITGVQFEPGPISTPFEQRPIGLELGLCKRYYQNLYDGIVQTNNSSSGNYRIFHSTFQTVAFRSIGIPYDSILATGPSQVNLMTNSSTSSNFWTWNITDFTINPEGLLEIRANYGTASANGTPDTAATWQLNAGLSISAEL